MLVTHVGAELEVGSATADVGIVRVVQVTVQDLLGEGELAVEAAREKRENESARVQLGRDKRAKGM
jgi:hypothetical protein